VTSVEPNNPRPQQLPALRPKRRSRGRTGWRRLWFLAPLVVYLALLFGYPLGYSVAISLENVNLQTLVSGGAKFIGLANYIGAWRGPIIWHTFFNTWEFTVASIVLQFAIGMLLAILFNQKFPLRGVLRSLILVPWLIPAVVSGAIFNWMFSSTDGVVNAVLQGLHLINSPINWLLHPESALWVIIITNVWIGIPFNMVLLYSGLQAIPKELYEAASIDGATAWTSFWKITLPNMKAVIGIVLMLGIIYTLKVFDIVMSLTQGGPANLTQLLSTWSYTLSFTNFNFGQGAAVANGLIVIALFFGVIYLWFSKRILD